MNNNGNGAAPEIQIPLIPLNNVSLMVQDQPNGDKVILMGPIMLALPVNEDAKKAIVEQLTGITIAGADTLP